MGVAAEVGERGEFGGQREDDMKIPAVEQLAATVFEPCGARRVLAFGAVAVAEAGWPQLSCCSMALMTRRWKPVWESPELLRKAAPQTLEQATCR